jgi:two-component system KDP operon response regulator KdpE
MNTPRAGPRPATGALRAPLILVVDDEPEALLYATANLHATGALARCAERAPDLIVLDLMMPGLDGFALCREIRRSSRVPIVVLSARDREYDKVHALDLGADDYLTKPFGVEEFLARVRAMLRRNHVLSNAAQHLLTVGHLTIDLEARQVTVAGRPVRLTPTEFALLAELARHPGKVLTQRHLLQRVWGTDYGDEGSYLHTYMRRLRQKIEADPRRPALLVTEQSIGYRLVPGEA